MKQCTICFDNFDDTNRKPRRLHCCGFMLCSACILSDICDNEYNCPECFKALSGNVYDISDEMSGNNLDSSIINNPDTIEIYSDKSQGSSKFKERGACSFQGCTKKEIEGGFCMQHSNRQEDFLRANKIAANLKSASFDTSILRCVGDKAINRNDSSGAINPETLRLKFSAQQRLELGKFLSFSLYHSWR